MAAIPFGWQVENAAGTPVSGAKIYFYIPSTTTPRSTYTDTALTVPAANPVIADAAGWFGTYTDKSLAYDVVIKSADDSITYRSLTIPADSELQTQSQNYATLAAIEPSARYNNKLVYVASRATDGDGGEGWWRFDAASSATANAGTILAPDVGSGRWIRQYTGAVLAEWFGARGNGTTDDTVAIQAALTMLRLAGGGTMYLLPDRTYSISAPLLVGSGTWVKGGGWTTVLAASNAFQTGSWTSYSSTPPGGLCNYNSAASTFLDSNIWVSDFKVFMNIENSFALYNESHAGVFFRKVRGIRIHNMWFTDGSNGTAIINCEDAVTTDTLVTRFGNAGIDHWEGSKRIKVSNCTVLGWCDANFDYTAPPAGIASAQGIQFTGTGSFDDNNYVTEDVTCIGCTVKFLPEANCSGIIANANAANSRVDNARFIGNDVEDCNLPIVFSGRGSGHTAAFNKIHDSTGTGMYASQAASGHSPSGVQIVGNHFKNVTLDIGATGLIGSNGDDGYYDGNVTESCTYDYAFYLDGDDNQIGQQNMPGGTSGSLVTDNGTGNTYGQVTQAFDLAAVLEFGGAAVGITSTEARLDYVKIGQMVSFTYAIFLTSKGSSSGDAEIDLPFAAQPSFFSGTVGYFDNFAVSVTSMNWLINPNGTVLRLYKNGTTVATNADFDNDAELVISGTYITNSPA
jgi:hypothetical protein